MMCQQDRSPFRRWGTGAGEPWALPQAESSVGPPESPGALMIRVAWSKQRPESSVYTASSGALPQIQENNLYGGKEETGGKLHFQGNSQGGRQPLSVAAGGRARVKAKSCHRGKANSSCSLRAGGQKPLDHTRAK